MSPPERREDLFFQTSLMKHGMRSPPHPSPRALGRGERRDGSKRQGRRLETGREESWDMPAEGRLRPPCLSPQPPPPQQRRADAGSEVSDSPTRGRQCRPSGPELRPRAHGLVSPFQTATLICHQDPLSHLTDLQVLACTLRVSISP